MEPFWLALLLTILSLLAVVLGMIANALQICDWLADHHFSLTQIYESLKERLKTLLKKSK